MRKFLLIVFLLTSNSSIASAAAFCAPDEPTSSWNECYGSGKLSNGEVYDGIWIAGQPKGSSSAQSSENTNTKKPNSRPEGELKLVSGGSGFAVSDSHVVTNSHVINGCKVVAAFRLGINEPFALQILFEDEQNDIAVLKSLQKLPESFSLASDSPTLSEDVFVAGFPGNLTDELQNWEVKVTKGVVSSSSGISQNPNMFFVDAPMNPGNSGGPLTNTKAEVVGVAVAVLRDSNNGFIAVSNNVVKTHLRSLGIEPKIRSGLVDSASARQRLFRKAVYALFCYK